MIVCLFDKIATNQPGDGSRELKKQGKGQQNF